jgi:hypothetical protein
VILVNFLLYTPMLPEAASGTLEPRHVVVPIRMMCPHADLVLGRALGLVDAGVEPYERVQWSEGDVGGGRQGVEAPQEWGEFRFGAAAVWGEFFPERRRVAGCKDGLVHRQGADRRHVVLGQPACDGDLPARRLFLSVSGEADDDGT